jgi:integrase
MPEYSVQRFRNGFAIVYRSADGTRVRKQLRSTDRAGAEAEARRGWQTSPGEQWLTGRIVTAYIADREADGISSTARQRDAWKAMRSFWEDVDPQLIDREMAQAYAVRRGMSEATVRYELSMLSVAFRWAVKKGHIAKAPDVWRPQPPERRVRHLTRAEFEKWFAKVKAPHARLYVELGLATMARPSAILELTWDRVDFERGTVDLNPRGRRQTRKRRPVVPLNDDAVAALEEGYRGRQSQFVIERGGKPVASIKKAFQAASERSGIHVTPYTLRHTGAVWAAEAGVSMAELATFMGHDDSTTTEKHYVRFSPGHLRKVANAVQRRVKPRPEVQSEPSTPVHIE